MDENSRTLSKMSLGDVIDYSIEIYKKNFKKITLLALYFHVPFMFIYTLVISYFSSDFMGSTLNLGNIGTTHASSPNLPYTLMAYYLVIAAMGLIYIAYSITLKSVMDASVAKIVYSYVTTGETADLKTIIRSCFKRFKSLVGNRVLSGLIIFGIFLGAYIVLIILAVIIILVATFFSRPSLQNGVNNHLSPVGGIIAGALAVLVLIAVIVSLLVLVAYLTARFNMGIQAVIIENKTASSGISRCNVLVKKNFWHVSMTFIFGILLFYTIPTLMAYGAQILLTLNKNFFILASTAVQIFSAVINPFVTILLTVLFINLKIKAEGLDLELKVDKLLEEQKKNEIILDAGVIINAE